MGAYPPAGASIELSAGPARAVVVEVGAGLRAFEVGGVPLVETYPASRPPPRGSGAVLVPWPNRVRDGRWSRAGTGQQLALTEPGAGNAIHGLLRHVVWRVEARAPGAVTLAAVAPVQPGWPEPVRATVTYALVDGLTVTHTVQNLGAGPIGVGVGAHPYLRVGAADTDACTLTVAATTVLDLDDRTLPTGPARPVTAAEDLSGGRPLAGLALDTPYGGCAPAPGDDRVRHRLTGPDGAGVELWTDPDFRWVQVFTPDAHPGRGRAVAVEPMTCPPDALNSGTDLVELAAGAIWSGRWGLRPFGF